MNDTVIRDFAEAERLVNGDRAAAAQLVLASALRDGQPPLAAKPPSAGQPLTVPEVARCLRIRPAKVLAWVRSGELRGYDVTARQGGRRPKYRINPEDLKEFIQRRAIAPSAPVGRPAGPRRIPIVARPHLSTAKGGHNSSLPANDHR